MKQVLAIIVLTISIVACKKNDSTTTNPQSSVSFLANGTSITVSGSLGSNFLKKVVGTNSQKAGYSLVSLNAGKYVISLFLLTDSDLIKTSYNTTWNQYPSGEYTICNFPNQLSGDYANSINGDFMLVNITQIQNGYANGTFSGQMTNLNNQNNKVIITNGQFTYLKISN